LTSSFWEFINIVDTSFRPRRESYRGMQRKPEVYLRDWTDEELVDSVLEGNRAHFDLLIERWQKPLFNFVLRFLNSEEEARDACQDAFVNAYRNLAKFKKESKFSSWLFKIAINRCNTLLRKRQRWRMFFEPSGETEFADSVVDERNAEQMVEREQIYGRIRRAVSQLPPEQKAVLLLKTYEGLKFHEISEMLSCPVSTVKSRMYYALDGLRKALKLVEVKNP
jgi:RNA polymerase sigma-70 factor, ECF subfamily